MVSDDFSLIVIHQTAKDFTKGKIEYIDQLKNVEVVIDQSNPRALIIASKVKVSEIVVDFENINVLLDAKETIEIGKERITNRESNFIKTILREFLEMAKMDE